MSKAPIARLEHLHNALTEELIRRIESGAAESADLSAAIKLLKDNGVDARSRDPNELNEKLHRFLPFHAEEEEAA